MTITIAICPMVAVRRASQKKRKAGILKGGGSRLTGRD
jgi:hypothetical protein